jgi:putative phage-type endonuclease
MIRTDCQTEEKWLAERMKSLGSSDAPRLMGESRFGNRLTVYTSKIKHIDSENEAAHWGKLLEPTIAQEAAERLNIELLDIPRFVLWRDSETSWMHASPDTNVKGAAAEPTIMEIKAHSGRQDWSDGVPMEVQVQCQHQMAVMKVPQMFVACLLYGRELKTYILDFNEQFAEVLTGKEKAFWYDYVVPRVVPEPDGSDASAEALKTLFPHDNGETVALDESSDLDWELAQGYQEQLKMVEKKYKEYRNKIKGRMGDATFGRTPLGRVMSLGTTNRKGFSVAPSSYRSLRCKEPK